MAIDNREKRASITGIHLPMVGPGVTNNVAKDAEWRGEVGRGYPFATAAVGPPAGSLALLGVGV